MRLMARIKLYLTLVGVGTVLTMGYGSGIFKSNQTSPFRNRGDVPIQLHVIFDDKVSHPVITVQLSMTLPLGGVEKKSPYDRTIQVPRGTRVSLNVLQGTGGHTECTLLRDGVIVAHEEMWGPGNISCQYQVE